MNLRRPKQLEFTEESITEERVAQRENLRHLWWVSLELNIQQNVNQHTRVKKLSETRNKHPKILEERDFGTFTGYGRMPVPTSQIRKLIIHRALYRILRKFMPR